MNGLVSCDKVSAVPEQPGHWGSMLESRLGGQILPGEDLEMSESRHGLHGGAGRSAKAESKKEKNLNPFFSSPE